MSILLNDSWENICKSKDNWIAWLFLAENNDKEMYDFWTNTSVCENCDQLDIKYSWCKLQELPCTVNPILTIKGGMIGMACMGAYRLDKKHKV